MSNYLQKNLKTILSVILFGLLFLVAINIQTILDEVRFKNYEPAPEISKLADQTTMTRSGRKFFYISNPELLSGDSFWDNCSINEETIVLGCYTPERRIFLLDVEEQKLEGVVQVTAAHEMLHAAYDRLSRTERGRVDDLTQSVYEQLSDQRVIDSIDSYRQRDPGVVPEELHSILGTEVMDLSPELEQYYAKYFYNRRSIVEFANNYKDTFDEAKRQLEDIKIRLDQKKADLVNLEAEITNQFEVIQVLRDDMNEMLERDDVEQYNSNVDNYNELIRNHRLKISAYNAKVEEFNLLVNQYNNAVVSQRSLYEAIDTRPEPVGQFEGL
jgi:hypothetical protein